MMALVNTYVSYLLMDYSLYTGWWFPKLAISGKRTDTHKMKMGGTSCKIHYCTLTEALLFQHIRTYVYDCTQHHRGVNIRMYVCMDPTSHHLKPKGQYYSGHVHELSFIRW